MKTHYFTFGQTHTHSFNGITLDKNVVVKITSEDPREKMVEYFGDQWCFEYNGLESVGLEYYPKGIFNANKGKFETSGKDL